MLPFVVNKAGQLFTMEQLLNCNSLATGLFRKKCTAPDTAYTLFCHLLRQLTVVRITANSLQYYLTVHTNCSKSRSLTGVF